MYVCALRYGGIGCAASLTVLKPSNQPTDGNFHSYLTCTQCATLGGRSSPLSAHILIQARLLSNIRTNPDQPLLFHYSNFQHYQDFQPRLADNHMVMSQPSSIRLEQNSARILTHIAYAALLTTEGHTANSSSILDMETINDKISMACKRFVDSLYDRSDQAHFVGSFVDAYDIFVSGMFYIHLEQRHGSDAQNYDSPTKPEGVRGGHSGLANDMVNKCCTLIAGVEARFGAVKAFRRVLRDFSALTTGTKSFPQSTKTVREACLLLVSFVSLGLPESG